jgi:hypothetical protein
MDRETYRRLYDRLATEDDVRDVARSEGRDEELLFVIHTHRVTRDATRRFYVVKRQVPRLASQWHRGRTILDMATEWKFPPVLMGQILLQELGVPRKKVWQTFLHPETAPDARIRTEVEELLAHDPIYSPAGMDRQRARGVVGESRLYTWLEKHGIGYRTEKDLRGKYQKTPDALLDQPIMFYGQKVTWIESKGNFGDDVELKRNLKRQLGPYTELFGEGAVVYWFGYLDGAESPPGILLWDGETIEGLIPVPPDHPEEPPAAPPSSGPVRRFGHGQARSVPRSAPDGHAAATPP